MIDMAYIEKKLRMTNNCDISCGRCPLNKVNNHRSLLCNKFEYYYPEEARAIVEQWSKEHPRKTYLSEFLEKYPNAKLDEAGTPRNLCPSHLGYKNLEYCDFGKNCLACWNQVKP